MGVVIGALLILSGTLEEVEEDMEGDPVRAVANAKRGIWTVIFVFLGKGARFRRRLKGVCRVLDCPRTDDVDGATASDLLEIDPWNLRCVFSLCCVDSVSRSRLGSSIHEGKDRCLNLV